MKYKYFVCSSVDCSALGCPVPYTAVVPIDGVARLPDSMVVPCIWCLVHCWIQFIPHFMLLLLLLLLSFSLPAVVVVVRCAML